MAGGCGGCEEEVVEGFDEGLVVIGEFRVEQAFGETVCERA